MTQATFPTTHLIDDNSEKIDSEDRDPKLIARRTLAAAGGRFLGSNGLRSIEYESDEEIDMSCLHGWRAVGRKIRLGDLEKIYVKTGRLVDLHL
jgi:hypothetical protein